MKTLLTLFFSTVLVGHTNIISAQEGDDIIERIQEEMMILDEGGVKPRHMPIIRAYRQEFGPLDDISLPLTMGELERMCRAVVESPTCSDFRQEELLQCEDINAMSNNGVMALSTSFGEAVEGAVSATGSLIRFSTELAVDEEARELLLSRLTEDYRQSFDRRSHLHPDRIVKNRIFAFLVAFGGMSSSMFEAVVLDPINAVKESLEAGSRRHCLNVQYQADIAVGLGIEAATGLIPVARGAKTVNRVSGAAIARPMRTLFNPKTMRTVHGLTFEITKPLAQRQAAQQVIGKISLQETVKVLERLGYVRRQRSHASPHFSYRKEGMAKNIPLAHYKGSIPEGRIRSIIRNMDITVEEFFFAWKGTLRHNVEQLGR